MIDKIIYIKGMVCPRCSEAVSSIFKSLNLQVNEITLGEVVLSKEISINQKKKLGELLKSKGFELLDDKRNILINSIKTTLIDLVHNDKQIPMNLNISDYLIKKFNYDYSYMSNLFTATEGRTIEKYLINLRVERIKELLLYDELTLNEIAYKMHYSSTAYLSSQFKKVVGTSPIKFKKMNITK